MRRFHLLELHEAPWFPATWRKLFLDGLGYTITRLGMYHNAVEPFARLLKRLDAHRVLDLCTGSAEPILQLCAGTERYGVAPPQVMLSDLYPNVPHFEAIQKKHPNTVVFSATPVDAMHVPNGAELPRVRTMLSALHHFKPDEVRSILKDAATHADGVAVLECTARTWRNVAQILITTPISSAIITAFMLRPMTWKNIFYGLILPVVPLTALVDSLVSTLRTYTQQELQSIVDSLDVPDFAWEIGTVAVPRNIVRSMYIVGWRTSAVKNPTRAPTAS